MSKMLLVFHVVGAVFVVGPMAILPMSALRALRAGSASQVATQAKSTYLFSLLSLIVAVLGFGVMGSEHAEGGEHADLAFTTPWILTSVVLFAVAVLLNLFMVVPAMRQAAAQLEVSSSSPTATPGGPGNGYTAVAAGSGVVSLLLVVVVALMVWQP
jgi:uncharacterized membrane protein